MLNVYWKTVNQYIYKTKSRLARQPPAWSFWTVHMRKLYILLRPTLSGAAFFCFAL